MTERETFEQAIAANPEDDTARLVFADWLTEHGDEDRAELVWLQGEPSDTSRLSVRRSVSEILHCHPEWKQHKCPKCKDVLLSDGITFELFNPTCELCRGSRDLLTYIQDSEHRPQFSRNPLFVRGFIGSVECTLAELGEERACSCRGYPIKDCTCGGYQIPTFVPSPWAQSVVRALPVTRFVITDRQPARLVDSYVWRSTNDGNSALYELAEVPVWLGDGLGENQGPHSSPNNGRYRRWEYLTPELAIGALALAAGRLVRQSVYGRW